MVFVLNKNKKPLNMCTEAKARYLLDNGYAVVHKMYPFVIRLKTPVENPVLKEYTVKIDPGSRHTGFAIVDENNNVCFLMELEHRTNITMLLDKRRGARRNRRSREVRHRRCKFSILRPKKNARINFSSSRSKGWLPPSVKSILDNVVTHVNKLRKFCNITKVVMENVKFDIQLLENPDIQGIEYQQGTLFGYEVKEYLLYKFGHVCQYCKVQDKKTKVISNASKDSVLQVEHMESKHNNGTNSVKNLTIACKACNQDKGSLSLEEWYEKLKRSKSKLSGVRTANIAEILKDGVKPVNYKYTAKINSMRKNLYSSLKDLNLEFEASTGARTKMNRINQELPKEHYYDALCTGNILQDKFKFKTDKVLKVKACGRGSRFRGKTNSCGVIVDKYFPRKKVLFGFQTGDIVTANVTKGKKIGVYTGRVAVRSTGSFNITTPEGKIQGISYKYCKLLQRNDGYSYHIAHRNKTVLKEVS